MQSIHPRKLLRLAFTLCLIGICSWGGDVSAQDAPNAPAVLTFLPNVTGGSPAEAADLVYDFTTDSESESAWQNLSNLFKKYDTSLTRVTAIIRIMVDKEGAPHEVAAIRCIGPGCGSDAPAENEESPIDVQAPEDIELVVHLDASRSLVFSPLSRKKAKLEFVSNDEVLEQVTFACRDCTIQVTVNEHFTGVTPTPTVTAEPPTATPEPTPTNDQGGTGEIDNMPPIISDVNVAVSGKSAVVTWKTNEPATSNVNFGTTTSYGLGSAGSDEFTTSHSTALNGLTEATTYFCRIASTDANGNVAMIENTSFTTSAPNSTPVEGFLETFDGDPASPQPWSSANWDITVHSRNRETFSQLQRMDAHHGSQCEPPMATHSISAYQDAVFQCRNHMMTAIKADGYGLIYLTPAYQVDFTDGTATIRFDMSTFRSSQRDWMTLYVSPMEDHLQLALDEWLPDLGGEPKRAIKLKMQTPSQTGTSFSVDVIKDHQPRSVDLAGWVGYEGYLEPSAATRTTFELQISNTHVKFGMPEYDYWWVDTEIAPLDWTVGVVQFGHHSYSPEKDCHLSGGCSANTWHWDNVSVEPARPFTMIHATKRFVDASNGSVASFEAPAPESSYLRFAGIGQNIEISFDNGKTWVAAQTQAQQRYLEENFWSYFTPIPAGVQSVRFRGGTWYGNSWQVRDLSIWAE